MASFKSEQEPFRDTLKRVIRDNIIPEPDPMTGKVDADKATDAVIDLVDEMLPKPQMNSSRQKRQEDGTYKYLPAESVKDMGYNQAIKDIRQKLRNSND